MNGRSVAVAASMIVFGVVGLVIGAVALASGNYWPTVGLMALGALLVVFGVVLLRAAVRAARLNGQAGRRRRRPDSDGGGYGFYPMPAGDAGSGHVGRQRDGDHDNSDGTEPAGGGDSGGGWSDWGWSGGDSGGGWSGGGDSGGGGGSS
ncbi:hypothetical protein NIE79_003780 [Micromonospora sp. NIE79]|uniref:Uncharacterized protein n=1 Tax=Micromonospora trifolii TaxID=2911208 RepID=A0ABS9N5W1_9ACTN|nr:hypothetical protein [Micromonospora trifolii]MCG5445332.1 hypothetical protein [Micromonospora trifolii]